MQVFEVHGRTMREALEKAREDLGERAVVISHKDVRGGVALAVSQEAPRNALDLERLRDQAGKVFAAPQRPHIERPGTADVQRAMAASGASQNLIERVCEAVAGREDEALHPLDIAAEEIGLMLRVANAKPTPNKIPIFAFLGHSGTGKTTSLAKFAARLVRGRRRVGLATLDVTRVGAVEQIQAHGALLGVDVAVLREDSDWLQELHKLGRCDAILLDTSGNMARDARTLAAMRQAIEQRGLPYTLDSYLIFSAISSQEALAQVSDQCASLDPAGCVITKLDETQGPGPVLEHSLARSTPIAFLCNGPELAPHFQRATVDHFADLLLRGKIA